SEAWDDPHVRCLGVHFCGGKIDVDEYGELIIADHILMLFNADHAVEIPFTLPAVTSGHPWQLLVDTAILDAEPDDEPLEESAYTLQPCSLVVMRSPIDADDVAAEEKASETVLEPAVVRT